MNKKNLLALSLVWVLTVSSIWYAGASFSWKSFGKWFWIKSELNIDKELLESMSSEERKAYMNEKREEMKANFENRELVIDKLLNKQTLTSDEDSLRLEIIKERSEKKLQMEEMKWKMEEKKAIMEKVKSWIELTNEEQELINSFKWEMKWKMKNINRWFNR